MFTKQHLILERSIILVKFVLYTSLCSKSILKEPRSLHKRIFCVNLKREYFLCKMLLNLWAVLCSCNCLVLKDKITLEIAEVILLKQKIPGLLLIQTCCLRDCTNCLSGKGPCLKELVVGTKKRKMLEHKGLQIKHKHDHGWENAAPVCYLIYREVESFGCFNRSLIFVHKFKLIL